MNTNKNLKISTIGIGNGGCNIISYLANKNFNQTDLIAIDTNLQSLNEIKFVKKIELKKVLIENMNLGLNLTEVKYSNLESYKNLKENLKSNDVVFIVSTFGGKTGTIVSSIIAQICKELNIFLISIITTPFNWEGNKREELAKLGIEELKNISDLLIVISNEKLLEIMSDDFDAEKTFQLLDDAFLQVIQNFINRIYEGRDNKKNIKELLIEKLFVLNYKEHTLGVTLSCNSLNQMSDLENIEIKFVENN
ncbi:hypothetical protein N5T96_05165 [Aliarcobacter butzleri]|uniref:hypothetical protein n=1 Tax=Aliarcobacter butzleri TaxID=28197 RepID=UPI00065A2CE1|nr:hypothetical protein [Aliarcobacter butzleri]KLE03989.1 hypothetical protein AF78_09885 [Aliarcobacter butzleri L353]MCT7551914.1 hypothetical protein [Aliarcobacter butzleri]MCT7564085.1 hypothetical protein [Aliarcobacter butzleri]MCT7565723.1 hypothetical protein [Aliarcobacter butzleri]MCT7584520.1 hypothetical protein [Aliarcobacter butzleri]